MGELNSISALVFIETMTISCETISCLSKNPLFSCIITLYTIILLYFPPQVALSPVPILTALLLLSLLRLGSTQKTLTLTLINNKNTETKENNAIEESQQQQQPEVHKWVIESEPETGFEPDPGFEETFVEWDVRAPLEVIYEGEEEEKEDPNENDPDPTRLVKYPSLSLYYPETDSDSSSEGDFPVIGDWVSSENVCFRWEDEDRDGLIEITLDGNNKKREMGFFYVEEENMIEINISPVKNDVFNDEV